MSATIKMVNARMLVPRVTESAGGHQNAGPNSVSGMVSTLVPSFLVALVLLLLFLYLRTKIQRIYLPRTYLGVFSEHQKSPKVSQSMFGWIPEFLHIDNDYVLNHHSLDAYFFLRFWKQLVMLTGIGWPITWIILMPIYGTSHAGEQQFDKISFSNIDASRDSNRLYAVAIVAWILLGAIMYLIARESLFAIRVQQAYVQLPGAVTRIASRTVLFTGVPPSQISETSIRAIFPSVKTVWLANDTKELDELVEDRDKSVQKLEKALVKRSKQANDRKRKNDKKNDTEAQEDIIHWLGEQKRPTHRLKPIIGKKVDTIEYCEQHLTKLNPQIAKQQQAHLSNELGHVSAVFVEFDTIEAAHAAFHRTEAGNSKQYSARDVGLRPDGVIWKNLGMGTAQRKSRNAVVIALICLMILFWGPITAFVGALSNINSLTNRVPFLSFINKIPGPILGVVTGLLPVILLAVVMALVPIIMRLLFKLAGAATLAEVELRTQTWYFVFQFIQVFLITTLASGAVASATQILNDPTSATSLLATNLPKASNFYINYFVLYGLALAAQQLFNIVAVLLYFILGKFLDKTPRKMYARYTKVAELKWGSLYPKFVNLAVIAISYSCIAPLVLAFATISFLCLGFAYRYVVLYSVDTTSLDTHGNAYTKALQQLTTGVYLSELCLIGLMGVSSGSSGAAIGPLVIVIVLLVATIIFHVLMNRALSSVRKDIADEFNSNNFPTETEKQTAVSSDPKHISTVTSKVTQKNEALFVRLLRISPLPVFAKYLQTPMPSYADQERKIAYVNPVVTQPEPLIWIVHDQVGVSEKQKEEISEHLMITDNGAWWDEKGKLKTVWTDHQKQEGENALRQAPLWEEKVHY